MKDFIEEVSRMMLLLVAPAVNRALEAEVEDSECGEFAQIVADEIEALANHSCGIFLFRAEKSIPVSLFSSLDESVSRLGWKKSFWRAIPPQKTMTAVLFKRYPYYLYKTGWNKESQQYLLHFDGKCLKVADFSEVQTMIVSNLIDRAYDILLQHAIAPVEEESA